MTHSPGGHIPPAHPLGVRAVLSEGEAWVGADALDRYGAEFFAKLSGGRIPPENIHPVPDAGAVPLDVRKLSTVTYVSTELLNPTPPSEEDVARWRDREAREDARHAELLAAGGVVTAIARLHSPDEHRWCTECQDGEGAGLWPCRTWEVLDEEGPRPTP